MMILDVIKRVFRLLTVSMTGAASQCIQFSSRLMIYISAAQLFSMCSSKRRSDIRGFVLGCFLTILQILVFFCSFCHTSHPKKCQTSKISAPERFQLLR